MFITAFTSARHLSLFWSGLIQSMDSIPGLEDPFEYYPPSTSGSSKWPPSLRSPSQNLVRTSPLPHTFHMPRPSHSFLFFHPNSIWWAVRTIKLRLMKSSLLPCYLVLLRPKHPPHSLFSNTLSLCSYLNMTDQVPHPYRTRGKNILYGRIKFNLIKPKTQNKF
jgi:hypothetical protein